jgi:hypothetical protein
VWRPSLLHCHAQHRSLLMRIALEGAIVRRRWHHRSPRTAPVTSTAPEPTLTAIIYHPNCRQLGRMRAITSWIADPQSSLSLSQRLEAARQISRGMNNILVGGTKPVKWHMYLLGLLLTTASMKIMSICNIGASSLFPLNSHFLLTCT